jgi:hypothetical protein
MSTGLKHLVASYQQLGVDACNSKFVNWRPMLDARYAMNQKEQLKEV